MLDDQDVVYYCALVEQTHLPWADAKAVCNLLADIVMRWPGPIQLCFFTRQSRQVFFESL